MKTNNTNPITVIGYYAHKEIMRMTIGGPCYSRSRNMIEKIPLKTKRQIGPYSKHKLKWVKI